MFLSKEHAQLKTQPLLSISHFQFHLTSSRSFPEYGTNNKQKRFLFYLEHVLKRVDLKGVPQSNMLSLLRPILKFMC